MASDNSSLSDMNHSVLVLNDSFDTSLDLNKHEFDSSGIGFLKNNKLKNNENTKKITICVRKKPVVSGIDTIKVDQKSLSVLNSKISYTLSTVKSSHKFNFDSIYDENFTNMEIFNTDIKKLVDHALSGGSSSIIAYGQTNSGKTHTILNKYAGILFEAVKYALNYEIKGTVSFCEIYMGKCYDCLNSRQEFNLYEKKDEIYASCLQQEKFTNFADIEKIFEKGFSNRVSGSTDSNKFSSRSHAIIIIELDNSDVDTKKVVFKRLASRNSIIFVDLAGSEKGTDRRTCSKKTVSEGSEINKSLLAMKECIRGFECNNSYLPFRLSKLTQILKNSLLGDAMTCVIATISAEQKDIEQTLNTLRYMHRIKEANIGVVDSKDNTNATNIGLRSVAENLDSKPMVSSETSSVEQSQLNADGIYESSLNLESTACYEQKRPKLEDMQKFDRKLKPMTILNLDLIEDKSKTAQILTKNASVLLKTRPFKNPNVERLSHNFPVAEMLKTVCSSRNNTSCIQKRYSSLVQEQDKSEECNNAIENTAQNLNNTAESKSCASNNDSSAARTVTTSNNYPFNTFVPKRSYIEPYTLKLLRNKVYLILDEISEMVSKETNLNNLKTTFLELSDIKQAKNKL